MTFDDKNILKLYRADREHAHNLKRYKKRDGKRTCYFIHVRDETHDTEVFSEKLHVIERRGPKYKNYKPAKLRLPKDIARLPEVKKLLQGEALTFPFLSDFEKRIITLRALGESRAAIARRYSGGRSKQSYTAISIKGRLKRAYDAIRKHTRPYTKTGKFIHKTQKGVKPVIVEKKRKQT